MNLKKQEFVRESIQNQSSFIQDFVNDYLAREMHLGWGMERPNYLMTYNLDLRKIREYSESDRFHELTDEEVAKFHLNPDYKSLSNSGAPFPSPDAFPLPNSHSRNPE